MFKFFKIDPAKELQRAEALLRLYEANLANAEATYNLTPSKKNKSFLDAWDSKVNIQREIVDRRSAEINPK